MKHILRKDILDYLTLTLDIEGKRSKVKQNETYTKWPNDKYIHKDNGR